MITRHFLFVLTFFALLGYATRGQSDSTKIRSFWLVYKMGRGHVNVADFQSWAVSEGLSDVASSSNNTLIGFDFLYNHNRMVYGINSDIELRSFNKTEPYYFSFTLRAGYTLVQEEKFAVKALAGLGAGYVNIRFENGEPRSIEELNADYSDPLARASMFVGRLEVIGSYTLGKFKSQNSTSGLYPVLYFSAGVTPTLDHKNWRYGEINLDIDSNSNFVGQPIEIPQFYKAHWFITIGFAVAIGKP